MGKSRKMDLRLPSLLLKVVIVVSWQWTEPVNGYRPVIVMHGILSGPDSMTGLVGFIQKAHPGTEVYNVDAYNDLASVYTNMWTQVKGVYEKIQPVIDNATDGVDMICYSQGGLICRGILEMYAVNVHSFIVLSGPLAGQFGDTDYVKYLFPTFTKDHLYIIFYTKDGQHDISVANYWNDPHHQDLYREYNNFLPFLNNGSGADYRSNFVKIQQLVLIGGPDDGVITPWQSSHFAFYDENEIVVPMTSQDFYVKDSFGLRTLDQSGRVKTHNVSGVQHIHWHTNQSVFDCCIEPYLS